MLKIPVWTVRGAREIPCLNYVLVEVVTLGISVLTYRYLSTCLCQRAYMYVRHVGLLSSTYPTSR